MLSRILNLRLIFLFFIVVINTSNCWWLLSNAEISPAMHTTTCATVPGLTTQQRRICNQHPDVIKYLVSGLRSAISECQVAFKKEAWNCTLNVPGVGTSPLEIASRESAYVYAISAAGVSHALAKACSKGLIDDCGCGDTPTGSTRHGNTDFVWAGCSDNVKFGNTFGRRFVDQYDKQHQGEARSKMNLHNNRVGRRLMASSMRRECKCHGVSGSCVTKTCWKVVPRFDEFAMKMHEKYEKAQHVKLSASDQKVFIRSTSTSTTGVPSSRSLSLMTTGRTGRYLKTVDTMQAIKNELVYLDASPNYCAIDVKDRECGENCGKICCGRGWRTVRQIVDEPCHCEFVWCCEVKCKTCQRLVEKNFCM